MSYLIQVFVNMCLVTFHFWICAFGPFGFGVFGNGCFDLGSLVWVVGFGILGSGSLSIEAFVWISRLDLLDISFGAFVWICRLDPSFRPSHPILRLDIAFGSLVWIFCFDISFGFLVGSIVRVFRLDLWFEGLRLKKPGSWVCWLVAVLAAALAGAAGATH